MLKVMTYEAGQEHVFTRGQLPEGIAQFNVGLSTERLTDESNIEQITHFALADFLQRQPHLLVPEGFHVCNTEIEIVPIEEHQKLRIFMHNWAHLRPGIRLHMFNIVQPGPIPGERFKAQRASTAYRGPTQIHRMPRRRSA